jgi:hypothetical protein
VKKHLLLGILICVFSVRFLSAQICQTPSKVLRSPGAAPSSGLASGPTGQAIGGGGCPTPTPEPTPSPTPTPITGFIEPKYVVLTVTYAPPGSGSSVTYSNSTLLGTSLGFDTSFNSTTTQTTTVGGGFKIPILGISFGSSSTSSTQFTQQSDANSSVAVDETTTLSTTIPGPASSAVGLNHDVDIIWIWLNPVLNYSISSANSLTWTGFSFDMRDPVGEMDVIGVPVAFLNGHQPMPSNIADVLARRWAPRALCNASDPNCGSDGTEPPGLNASDLAAILQADPFANSNYVINIPSGSNCTADARFCRTTNQNLQYSPPPAGGQPITQSYTIVHQTTDTQGQSASETRQVNFSNDLNASFNFIISFNADLKTTNVLTTTNKWSSSSTQKVGQTAAATVTGPASTDNYTGPIEFEVFQDNIYGTFMFGFIPAPTFNLSATPASQSVVQGSCTSYTASVSALVTGFNSAVSFSVSGLPANATASFSPASVSGAGSSTLTVCTTASTPTGTSNLTINGASGIEVHSTNVSLTVNAPPPPPPPPPPSTNFNLTASPGFLDIATIPGSATSTVTVSPVSGFTGTVTLSLDGGGLPASLSSTSINSSGSVTLTVRAGRATPAGNYVVTVTGVSGNLTHSAQVTVTVEGNGGCQFCSQKQ